MKTGVLISHIVQWKYMNLYHVADVLEDHCMERSVFKIVALKTCWHFLG